MASIRGQLDVVAKQMGNNTRRRDSNEDDEGSNTIEETNSESMAMEAPLFSCCVQACKERNDIEENQKWHKNGTLKIEKLKFSKLCTILVVIIVKNISTCSFLF